MGNRTYQGRFKGSTDTHLPNDKSREGHLRTFAEGPSYVDYVCTKCLYISRVHKLELKIHRCPECGG